MTNFDDSKFNAGGALPNNLIESPWGRNTPLITPNEVMTEHLFGIPAVSRIKNPFHNPPRPDVLTPEIVKKIIIKAVSLAELDVGIDIMPNSYQEKIPWDYASYTQGGYLMVTHRPVRSVELLSVTSSDDVQIYTIPPQWIERANFTYAQINILPLAVAPDGSGTTVPFSGTAGGLLPSIFRRNWLAALWTVKYSTGFPNGEIPISVNELIGVIAAYEILSMLGATFAMVNSQSLSIDGLSESVSGPGPNIYAARLQDLADKRKWLAKKIKAQFALGVTSNNL